MVSNLEAELNSIVLNHTDERLTLKLNRLLILVSIVFTLTLVGSLAYGINEKFLFFILVGFLCLLVSLSSTLVYFLFVATIFLPHNHFLHVSVFFTPFIALSFLINTYSYHRADFKTPLNKAILIYTLSVLPSIYNSSDKLASLGKLYNLVALLIVMFSILISIRDDKKVAALIYLFLAGVFFNTIYTIYLALSTGNRAYGFSGIFYVDFVGLGALFLVIIFIYSKGVKKIFSGFLVIFFITGLILTQTRNAWLSFAVSFILLMLYLLKNHRNYFLSRKLLASFILLMIVVGYVVYFSASSISTTLDDRISGKTQITELTESTASIGENSFITRALIWHTAANAFITHPFVGIGVYSFPFSSQYYYTIPKSFYKVYVEGRTPHVTFIAVLAETGVIGFIGFVFLLIVIIKTAFQNLRQLKSVKNIPFSLIINWTFVYMLISMFMTDAWLWGQQLMIIAIFLGLLVAQNKKSIVIN